MPEAQTAAVSTAVETRSIVLYAEAVKDVAVQGSRDGVADTRINANQRDLASAVVGALHSLQEALDAAALAGLIVKPRFRRISNRFLDRGCDADSYIGSVEVYRKVI